MSTIRVRKRSGRLVPLNIIEIRRKTEPATEGLKLVSKEELEGDAQLEFYDGITTKEIQQSLIKTAISKIDIDRPDWTFVAARLFLYDIEAEVAMSIPPSGKKGAYPTLENYIDNAVKEERIVAGLKEKFILPILEEKIDPERDLQFTYLGVKNLADRYLLKNKEGSFIELPQLLFMGVSMFLAQNEIDFSSVPEKAKEELGYKEGMDQKKFARTYWATKFYDILSNFEVMAATPTLSNARTPRSQLSSCYVGATPDNIEGIFDTYKEQSLLSKFGGGIGWDWNDVRSSGSSIDGHKNAAGGLIPFLKIENDVAVAVDQLGTRKGAIAVYIEPWHMDVEEFLSLKKNSGEERRRAHDLFPAMWIPDLFMERVENDEAWTLFNPADVPGLHEAYGDEFRELYEQYENDPDIEKRSVSAKNLYKMMLREYFETGNPFLCFKDSANKANPNRHAGVIRSSNLCTEIFQNTEPNRYKVKVEFEDGSTKLYEENEMVVTDEGIEKPAKRIYFTDSFEGKKVFFIEKVPENGATAVCNLASINLSRVNTREKIEEIVPIAIRMLDNVIDLNFYPARKTKETNLKNRAIGLGMMGEAQMIAEKGIVYGSQEHYEIVDEVMEAISYNAIKASSELGEERGSYPLFEGSDWSKGIFPIDKANENALALTSGKRSYDWEALRKQTAKAMRNGYIMAVAPTSSISLLVGTTQANEPIFRKKYMEENLSGNIPVVAPGLSAATWEIYKTAYDLDQKLLVKAAAVRQKWIDQGQSLNLFFKLGDNPRELGQKIYEAYILAWKLGLKSTYYLRSQSPEKLQDEEYVEDRSLECTSCQ